MFDVVFSGGTVVDGGGGIPYQADVAVEGNKIAAIGDLKGSAASRRIDAAGMVVAPGFIDSHCHSELSLLADPTAESKLRQGVTTEMLGNCGWSAFPFEESSGGVLRELSRPIFGNPEIDWSWSDLAGYFDRLQRQGTAVNVATLVGHGNVRAAVLGLEDRPPTARELEAMMAEVQKAMDQGAFGISSGLAYPPGVYASGAELAELATVSGRAGGLYATHLRDQVDGLVESVQEALEIGRQSRAQVLISHHKSVGSRNYGKVQESLKLLDLAREEGLETSSDIYPYLAGSSSMVMLFPPWVLTGGPEATLARLRDPTGRARMARDFEIGLPGWENRIAAVGWGSVVISHLGSEKSRPLTGLTVEAAAARLGKPTLDFVCDLLVEESLDVGDVMVNSCEDDLRAVLTHPSTVVGSDGLDVGDTPHPRQYGTFPRILARYVREEPVLTLESAVHKMTGRTAALFGLAGLGHLRNGYQADVVVFDPATVSDIATYEDPRRFPVGIEYVMVRGVLSVADGRLTGDLGGQVRRRGTE
jgi:dihydroorotase/N-acyl-D-amino-acid deacylase